MAAGSCGFSIFYSGAVRRRFLEAALAAAAAFSPQAAQASWRQASTDHFVIYSEQKPEQVRMFAERLERFDSAMHLLNKLPDNPVGKANRLTVFIVSDVDAVQKMFGRGASGGGFEIAGFYIPRAAGSVAFVPRPSQDEDANDLGGQKVLFHEYAHHFMFRNFPGAYPAWFTEAFAEFYGTTKFERNGTVDVGAPAQHRAYGLFNGAPVPLAKLVAAGGDKMNGTPVEALYGRGWLLFHYLTEEPKRHGQLQDYVNRINRGEGSLAAAQAAFGDLSVLDRELDAYQSKPIGSWGLAESKLKVGQIELRELRAAENAIMPIWMRSKRGVNDQQAKALVPAARVVASRFPTDAAAQNALAEAEFDAGNFPEAEAAADRAIAADPKSVHALIYKARAQMGAAAAAKDASDAKWRAIRRIIASANRLDPDDPMPLVLFYESFGEEGRTPTANASEGLATAMALAPQDMELRMMMAHQHLVDGKAAPARAALAPIAFNPHGGKASQSAAAAIAQLDKGDVRGALEALSKGDGEPGKDRGAGR
jgi:Flp pilus assembly protein TadD